MTTHIAEFLRNIPQSNEDPQLIRDIVPSQNPDMLFGIAWMLQVLGAVEINDSNRIRATSQTAKYLLMSLASYVENNARIIDDWKTRGINRNGTSNPLQNGATFLHALETRRLEILDQPTPSRHVKVAQVLIKRTNPDTKHAEILFQFDSNANQYQLIGGRHGDDDKTLLNTMIREIEEELLNNLTYERDYQLHCLIEGLRPPVILSPTFGALSEYLFWIYHMVDLSEEIDLNEDDLWVPVEDILEGSVTNKTGQQYEFSTKALYQLMNDAIPGGFRQLADSIRN